MSELDDYLRRRGYAGDGAAADGAQRHNGRRKRPRVEEYQGDQDQDHDAEAQRAEEPPRGDAYEGDDAGKSSARKRKAKEPRFRFLSSAEFAAKEYRLEWLVRRLLV